MILVPIFKGTSRGVIHLSSLQVCRNRWRGLICFITWLQKVEEANFVVLWLCHWPRDGVSKLVRRTLGPWTTRPSKHYGYWLDKTRCWLPEISRTGSKKLWGDWWLGILGLGLLLQEFTTGTYHPIFAWYFHVWIRHKFKLEIYESSLVVLRICTLDRRRLSLFENIHFSAED